DWLGAQSEVFWIKGKAGSGKSTLMKFLSNHPETLNHLRAWAGNQQLITARFFFWNSGTALQKSQTGLLRSLLFEILRQCPEVLHYVCMVRARFKDPELRCLNPGSEHLPRQLDHLLDESLDWSHEELVHVYKCLVHTKAQSKFCFFIDGLDEFKAEGAQDHRELVSTLRELATWPNVKLCLASRPWTVFADAFTSTKWVLQLEDLTKPDIYRYVSDKFMKHDQYQKLLKARPGYSDLIGEVVRKVQGVFLWVFLVVRDLLDGLTYNDPIKTMHLRLNQFPDDLESYFQHMIDSIPKFYRKETAQVFQIALSREEPLSLITYAFVDDLAEDPNLGLAGGDIELTSSAIDDK
ncbi:uncharacterized protein LY89DRAFT_587891, partial [Mollisia scopiformis]